MKYDADIGEIEDLSKNVRKKQDRTSLNKEPRHFSRGDQYEIAKIH